MDASPHLGLPFRAQSNFQSLWTFAAAVPPQCVSHRWEETGGVKGAGEEPGRSSGKLIAK